MPEMMQVFGASASVVELTHETLTEGKLQLLDVGLRLLADHISWAYQTISRKGILPFDSAHSKLVKRGIAKTFLEAAFN